MKEGKILDLDEYRKKVKESSNSINDFFQSGEPGAFWVEDFGRGVERLHSWKQRPPEDEEFPPTVS